MVFKDRQEAGVLLADKLVRYKDDENLLVLGVPRGGVVLADEVAKNFKASLDIIVTRKIGHPTNPEYAIAAVDEDGVIRVGHEDLNEYGDYLKKERAKQSKEIKRRLKEYRGKEKHPDFENRTCVIVDDGIATGLTTLSAIQFIKNHKPKKVVLAVPVVPKEAVSKFETEVDDFVYIEATEMFYAVGQFYEDFPQVEDTEVKDLLDRSTRYGTL